MQKHAEECNNEGMLIGADFQRSVSDVVVVDVVVGY